MIKNLYVNIYSEITIQKKEIHSLAAYLKKELRFDITSLYINFVSSEEITDINRRHLDHNFSTDIITFNYSGDNQTLEGEIFISPEEARNNARLFHVKYEDELYRLIIHGILHMIGYDDINEKLKKVMFALQEKLLSDYLKTIA